VARKAQPFTNISNFLAW